MTYEQLNRYQSADLAATKGREQGRRAARIATRGMREFYRQNTLDERPLTEDPIIALVLGEAEQFARAGTFDARLQQAALSYGGRYQELAGETSVNDLVRTVRESGYESIPEELTREFGDRTLNQVREAAEGGNENAQKAVRVIGLLEEAKFDAQLSGRYLRDLINEDIERVYPQPQEGN